MKNKIAKILSVLFLFIMTAQTTAAQTGTSKNENHYYRGVVVDEENEPLPGVSITVKDMGRTGTVTNAEGEFSLTLQKDKATLCFSYVGMKPQEIRAQGGKRLVVSMSPDAAALSEVVVNGIYTRNIESFTGSVTTFNAEQLKTIAPQGILKSLSILDPSVVLTPNNQFGSDPNHMADISINGKMNVQALAQEYETDPNQPLFILDGFESTLQAINDLNMDRVESISILKDASATAIYGSKAANGVIVVETRKPTAGRLRVSYNGSLSVAWADLSDYNLMNAAEKLQYELLAGEYNSKNLDTGATIGLAPDGLPAAESQRRRYMARLEMVKSGRDTYWMNEPLRTAFTQTHNLYIEGGDQAFRYGAGLSYNKNEGIMKNSDRNTINGNINLTYRVDNFSFTNQTSINYTNNNNETVPFSSFVRMNPFYDKRDENGNVPKYVYQAQGEETIWNPLWDFIQKSFSKGSDMAVSDNFQFEWRASRFFRLRGNAQYSTTKLTTETFVSPDETSQANLDRNKRGRYNNNSTSTSRWSTRINATYGCTWGVHTLNAVGGAQFQETHSKSYGFGVQGYTNDHFWNPNFSNGYPEGGKPSSRDNKTRNASFFANLNYAYDMRYLVDVNFTRSGASQFGIDDPFTDTWSAGIGWNIHNEPWFNNAGFCEFLKLRASYGNPGNQNYDAKLASSIYQYYNNYTNPFGLAGIVEQWGNNGLKWQKSNTYNIGVTATIFNRKLSLNADYQIRKNEPQLVRIDLPSSTGVTTTPINLGGTDNRSISASATFYIFNRPDMNWYVSANANHYKTKYYGIGNTLEQYNEAGRLSKSLVRMYDGASTTGMYVVRSAGIDPATGNEIFIRKDGSYTYKHDSDDEVLYGDSNPDLTGAFSTSFLYKGFSIVAAFTFRTGGDIFLSTLMNKVENISKENIKYNQDRRALTDRWKKPGDIAKYKRIDDKTTTNNSSRFIATEHTLECSSINIGYRSTTWPFLRTIGASSIDLRAYMNDIFRISNIKEERGLDYPFQRSFSLSLGISF